MTTNDAQPDALDTAREEYADAQESLSVELGTEFGQIVVMGNALEAADELITTLEAHAATQQQRIDALEKALADRERMLIQANSLLGTAWSYMLHVGALSDSEGGEALVSALEKWNTVFALREALHEQGAEGA